MARIDPGETRYKLSSPDGLVEANFGGSEVGMGGPTCGHVSLRDAEGRISYTSPSWSRACFSDCSRYFIHDRASSHGNRGYRVTVVVDCTTGKDEWVQEISMGEVVELRNREIAIEVNGIPLDSLGGCPFDVSRCGFTRL